MRLPRPPHAPPLAPIARAAASSLASVLLASSLLGGDVGPQLGPAAAFASQPLTEEQKLVAEAWRVTDREFVDREFGGQDWFSVRQKMLKQRYDSRVDAYDQVRAMLAALDDKYTRFLTPSAYDAVFATATGGVVGIGVELQTETEPSNRVTINNVVPGGPADRAGVRPGDEIVNADGEDCTRLSAEEASKYVRGAAGSKLRLVGIYEEVDRKLPSIFGLADGGTDVFPGTRRSQVGAVALGNVFGNGRVDIVIGHQTFNGGPPELVENTGNRGFGSVVPLDPPGWIDDGECTDAPPNLNPPGPSERNVCVGKSGCVEMTGGYGYWLCCSPSEDGTPCLRPNKQYDNPYYRFGNSLDECLAFGCGE
ncbi:hypothetical protein EMIHUDRAFT_214344 [Emiliania huxleyi CCMP1516]|uniref:PDZ domain-containing protein n=2 Tax=Emiliania huxleyi TaxID=2903 RepID=A0A0D3IJU8_EMIH1|nr:hypothetical protein EMIHUDRAFT_214344 [Emiliania huxleyi CCMP1516]EOD11533.1 hypothetical protein EMIHUDRAFT_214344 [Emiliania huxleyi CCMP1516]|eukprot:XP_005763962.1 hypothetical protein EMIHUDRAFT_214344 [Emiliania huxleyi CCMP1516]